YGDVEDVRILIEDLLGAVPVVHVPVDDRHASSAESEGVSRGEGDLVDQTEPHRSVRTGVMTWWPDERETTTTLAPHGLRQSQGATRGHLRDVHGALVVVRVRVEEAARAASLEQGLDVLGRMDGAQLVGGGNAGADALPQAGRGAFEPASTRPETLGALGVRDVGVLERPVVSGRVRLLLGVEPVSVEERVIEDEQFHAKSVPSSSVVRHGSRVLRSLVASCGRGPG